MRKLVICTVTALMVLSSSASAAEDHDTGNFMLPYCKLSQDIGVKPVRFSDPSDIFYAGICMGMITGIASTLREHPDFCVVIPATVIQFQAVAVVVRYMESHPQDLHNSFRLLTASAIKEAWPCRK